MKLLRLIRLCFVVVCFHLRAKSVNVGSLCYLKYSLRQCFCYVLAGLVDRFGLPRWLRFGLASSFSACMVWVGWLVWFGCLSLQMDSKQARCYVVMMAMTDDD